MKISNNASSGGTTFGGTHESGNDIKMIVIGGDNVRLEGGEGVLSRLTMKDNKKYNFNGKLSTPCEIASELNVKNGGRKFDCSNELQQKVDEFGDGGNTGNGWLKYDMPYGREYTHNKYGVIFYDKNTKEYSTDRGNVRCSKLKEAMELAKESHIIKNQTFIESVINKYGWGDSINKNNSIECNSKIPYEQKSNIEKCLIEKLDKLGYSTYFLDDYDRVYYKDGDKDNETTFDKITKITIGFYNPNKDKNNYDEAVYIGKTIKLPKKKQVDVRFILDKINSESVYKSFADEFSKLLKKKFNIGNGLSVYPTTYGIGIFVLFNHNARDTKRKIDELLNELGIEYYNEFSDAKYVYRYKISKKKENIDKIKKFIKK